MINENIYGDPTTWSTTQFVPFAKTVNYGTTIQDAELTDGVNAGKTPVNELIENSICTAALGSESLYSNIIWEHNRELSHDSADYTPYFYANCYDSSGYSADRGHIDGTSPRYNAWKTFQPDVGNRRNKSLHSRVIGEFQPKKILYELIVGVCPANDFWNMHMYTLGAYLADTTLQTSYPKIFHAGLRAYFDSSSTDTPNREASAAVRLFGVCINRELSPFALDYNIDYALVRGFNNYNSNIHIPIYGLPMTYIGSNSNYYNLVLAPEADITRDGNNIHIMHDYSPEFIEYLIKQAACFGAFVRISNSSGLPTSTIPLDNDDIICGELVNGVGHGNFTRGAANRDNDIWNWQTNRDSNYDPYNPPDPNTYSDETTFNFIGGLSSMFKRYVLNAAGVDALGQQLFKIGDDIVVDQSDSYQDYQEIILNNFLTNNPIDAIISLKKYPLANIPHADTSEQLRLGKKQISVVGYRFPYTNFRYLFGAIDVFPRFENTFLDYAPYTTLEIYVPFCGTKELDTGVYMGHKLSVELQIDFTTGNCDAYIKCDNLVTDTISGQCAIDIPVTGTESATVDSQITNGIIQGKAARGKATTDFASANFSPGGWIKSITNPFDAASNRFENKLNRAGAEYNVSHTQTPLRSVGTSTPVGGWTIDFNCRLFITYPTGSVINNNNPPSFNAVELAQYGHINGFATVEAATMANFKIQGAPSFVVADSINLDGIAATETEKDLIRAACKEGCYI